MPALKSLRQERFAQAYVMLGIATQAYKQAYKYTGKNADINAHQILVRPSVSARIAEIRREIEVKVEFEREEALRILADVARHAERDADRVAAVDKLSKMCGWDQPQRMVITADPFGTYLEQMRQTPLLRD